MRTFGHSVLTVISGNRISPWNPHVRRRANLPYCSRHRYWRCLTLAVGQIIVRGGLEPALELKRFIGTIASDLDFYANRFNPGTPEEKEWRDLFRKHSCNLREKLNVIVWYPLFERVFQLPPEKDVRAAAAQLLGHSNRAHPPVPAPELGAREDEIKKLLRIKT
jgi:hypothetical protein